MNPKGKIKKTRVFAFDFDGVVAEYKGFKGDNHVEKPIQEVVKAIHTLKKQGHRILLFSSRSTALLKSYCRKYKIPVDYFNHNPEMQGKNRGKPIAYAYVDDRAILYHGQKAPELVRELKNFKAYWQ